MNGRLKLTALIALVLACLAAAGATTTRSAAGVRRAAAPTCTLRGPVKHVIYVQFDNTHLRRDDPNVPSDLEQMPHLLNFMKQSGTLLTNDHTILIAHTGTGILSSLTGLYGDRMGVPVSNSYRYFTPTGASSVGVSFAYWTAPIFDPTTSAPTDTTPNMITPAGRNTPAPWVPYTRAGCDFGAIATANTVLENTGIDIPTVFGAGSAEAAEVKSNPGQAFADFVGIAVHCAAGSTTCASGRPDLLPQEPRGYQGYNGLFGDKVVRPVISPGAPLTDLNGNEIKDAQGHVGFPGFDGMSAAVSLGYVAAMQEHGIPVTYAYVSDAHDAHLATGNVAYGPGEAGYVAQLRAYDDAFAKFFDRLARDGITRANTLFVFTVDEGDHFVGGPPSPAGCDGVTTPCTYQKKGEVNANMAGLLATQQGVTTPFAVHADSAPTVYVDGHPERTDPKVRELERASGKLTATNPITGATDEITRFLADPVEERLLHMQTGDPARTPTFTLFADPNYFLFAGAKNCNTPCVTEPPAFAWNHGDVSEDIGNTWLGIAGPGVRAAGENRKVWSDHTDVRPTMLSLLGLRDDYAHDGRPLTEVMAPATVPKLLRPKVALQAAQALKQINADFGPLAFDSLAASTKALEGDDATYATIEGRLAALNQRRDVVAGQLRGLLENAAYYHRPIRAKRAKKLIAQAKALLAQAKAAGT